MFGKARETSGVRRYRDYSLIQALQAVDPQSAEMLPELEDNNTEEDLIVLVARQRRLEVEQLLERVSQRVNLEAADSLCVPTPELVARTGHEWSVLRDHSVVPQLDGSSSGYLLAVASPNRISVEKYLDRGIKVQLALGCTIKYIWREYQRRYTDQPLAPFLLEYRYSDDNNDYANHDSDRGDHRNATPEVRHSNTVGSAFTDILPGDRHNELCRALEQLAVSVSCGGGKEAYLGAPDMNSFTFFAGERRFQGELVSALNESLIDSLCEIMKDLSSRIVIRPPQSRVENLSCYLLSPIHRVFILHWSESALTPGHVEEEGKGSSTTRVSNDLGGAFSYCDVSECEDKDAIQDVGQDVSQDVLQDAFQDIGKDVSGTVPDNVLHGVFEAEQTSEAVSEITPLARHPQFSYLEELDGVELKGRGLHEKKSSDEKPDEDQAPARIDRPVVVAASSAVTKMEEKCDGAKVMDSASRRNRLVLIEDNICFSAVIKQIMSSKNWDVVTFSTADAALKEMHTLANVIDLVICDAHLPGLSGAEFVRRVKQEYSALPVLVLTSEDDKMVQVDFAIFGADAFVHKSEDPRILLAWCANLVKKSRRELGASLAAK